MGLILQTILSVLTIYALFQSFAKNFLAQIALSWPAPLGPGRSLGDRPAGCRLKIASAAERQRDGWRCTVTCAFLSGVGVYILLVLRATPMPVSATPT